jgi:hypothetical protein
MQYEITSLLVQISHFEKIGLHTGSNELNKQRRNRFLQREGMPQSI